MKKIMNNPAEIVDEMLDGMVVAYSDLVARIEGTDVIRRATPLEGKVGIISGGGSGHEPAHAGFVGKGMLTAAACGAVFTSPTPDQILEAIKAADDGAGVMMVVKNYSGDLMNFEMAQELAAMEGIEVESVIVDDDIAMEDSLYTQGKRGVAGTVLVHKILGHAAEQGASLAEVKALADQLVPEIKTLGIALSGTTTPEGGKESFDLAEEEIEYGVGIHGEPGYRTEKLRPSRDLAEELLGRIRDDFGLEAGDRLAVLVNGMGGTPLMEQYVFTKDVADLLADWQLEVDFWKVGNYMTSIEMEGLSLTVMRLQDPAWLEALEAPVEVIGW